MPEKKKGAKTPSKELVKLQEQIAELEKKCTEHEEIAKRAQSDYVRLKMDMDSLITRTEEQKKHLSVESLVKVAQKVLPFVWQLKTTVETMNEEVWATPRWSGVVLVYEKMLWSLEQLHIKPIIANAWDEPDLTKHMPINMQPVEDEALKGKIVTEIEQGYLYNDNWKETIIIPSKVVVGQ